MMHAVTSSNSEATLRRARSDREVEMWACPLAQMQQGVGLSAASPRTPGLRAGVAVGFPLLSLTQEQT